MRIEVYRKEFCVATLNELMTIAPERITTIPCIPEIDVAIPPVVYGQRQPPGYPVVETPNNNWFEKSYSILDGNIFSISDAVVHGELGIITVGDYLVRESLHFALPEYHGFTWKNANTLEMPALDVTKHLDKVFHAMCGYVGSRNYSHWWVDVVPAIGVALQSGLAADCILLMPVIRSNYQKETLDLVPEITNRVVSAQEECAVRCDKLFFNHRVTASDYTPHPQRMAFIRELKARAGAKEGPNLKRRKLYISRRDSGARPLSNVDDVEALVARYGYEVVQTSGISVREQIKLFSALTHVIAPHGAGLANILFCQPYTKMLELHYDQNVNWSLRRLASILPMTYGLIVGRGEQNEEDQKYNVSPTSSWALSISELQSAIEEME